MQKSRKTQKSNSINQELQQRVSLETGIDLDIVQSVTNFPGTYTADVIKAGMFEAVMWPNLGVIKAPIKAVQKMNDKVGRVPYTATKKPK